MCLKINFKSSKSLPLKVLFYDLASKSMKTTAKKKKNRSVTLTAVTTPTRITSNEMLKSAPWTAEATDCENIIANVAKITL